MKNENRVLVGKFVLVRPRCRLEEKKDFKKCDMRVWIVSIRFRIRTSGRLL
jgi:hypothetical protein